MPPGLVKAITAPPFAAELVAASSAMISPSALSPAFIGHARQGLPDRSRRAAGDRRGKLVVSLDQRGLLGVPGIEVAADDDIVGLGADDLPGGSVELEVDRGDQRAELVARGDEPSVDVADIGFVGVAADHNADGGIQLLDDVDDRPGDAGAFVVVAGRKAAFMDQHDDGFDAARHQFRHQRVHRDGLVAEFEAHDADRRNDPGRALQGQPDESRGDAFELPDLIGRQDGLAGRLVEG
jgi:hypothetical protein